MQLRVAVSTPGGREIYPLPSLPPGIVEVNGAAATVFAAGIGVEIALDTDRGDVVVRRRAVDEVGEGPWRTIFRIGADSAPTELTEWRMERRPAPPLSWRRVGLAGPAPSPEVACARSAAPCPLVDPGLLASAVPTEVVGNHVTSRVVGIDIPDGTATACGLLLERHGAYYLEEGPWPLCTSEGTARAVTTLLAHHLDHERLWATVWYREQAGDLQELWHMRCRIGGKPRCERATESSDPRDAEWGESPGLLR